MPPTTESRITEPDPCHRLLEAEVPAAACREEMEAVLRRFARKARVPGFRPGKVPAGVIRRHFEREIREEAGENLMRRVAEEVLREARVEPLGGGRLEDLTFEGEGPLRFRALFEVRPKFDARDYRGIPLERRIRPVADPEIDRFLESLREENYQLEPLERTTSEDGDYALVDFIELPRAAGEAPVVQENVYFRVGDERNFPVVNDALRGLAAGEEREFTVSYPDEHPDPERAGRSVTCKVRLRALKTRVLPALDDDFARHVSPESDLASLRARIRRDLEEARRRDAEARLEDDLLKVLVERNPVPAPPTLVEEQTSENLRRLLDALLRQGIDPRRVRLDWSEERRKIGEASERQVRADLVLERIGEMESVTVTDEEVDQALRERAQQEGVAFERVQAALERSGRTEALRRMLRRRKILDFLKRDAKISAVEEKPDATDSDGG